MLITVRNLVKKVDKDTEILSGIQFDVGRGEFIAVIGSSGSGKTTLLRCITLQEKWDDGHFFYEGVDIVYRGACSAFPSDWCGAHSLRRLCNNTKTCGETCF